MPRSLKKLNRQIKKYLKDVDLEDNTFDEFFDSVVNTYAQYEDKNKMARRNIELSSGELNDLNFQLQLLNISMAAILDNLGPALLFFDEKGACSSVYSKSCLDILSRDPAGSNIWDVLELSDKEKESFRSLIEFSFSNNSAMGFEDLFKMAPSEVNTSDQYLTIKYKPIYDSAGELKNILVIASDETEKLRTKNLLMEKEKRVGRLVRLVKYKDDYVSLLSDIDEYFLSGYPLPKLFTVTDLNKIRGYIHTLKGLVGSFSMDRLASIFHSCEDKISMPGISIQDAHNHINGQIESIKDAYDAEISDAQSILGDGFLQDRDLFQVNYHSLRKFYKTLQNDNADLAEDFKKTFMEVSLAKTLKKLEMYLEEAAARVNKKVGLCIVEDRSINIPHSRYNSLIKSFVHIIRNSVSHGIESSEVRKEQGKNEFGIITISINSYVENGNDIVELLFSDDGAGFNIDVIRTEIAKKDYDVEKMSNDQILNSVLDDGISSSKRVSQISGRGVGLSEVKHQVNELNGDIKILESEMGSKIMVKFPIREVS